MNRFAILRQCVILIVLFGNVRCAGNDRLWEFLHKATELWGVTVNCLCSGNNNNRQGPLLIIKLKELVVPLAPTYSRTTTFHDAYIIHGTEDDGEYFELAVVFENGQQGLRKVKVDDKKEAVSIEKLMLPDMDMVLDPTLLSQNKVRLCHPNKSNLCYNLTFKSYEQAKDIYDRYGAYWPELVFRV